MIELVLTVCLQAAPTDCRKEKMPFDGPVMSCAMAGSFVAADWINNHPKWQLARYRCGPSEHDA